MSQRDEEYWKAAAHARQRDANYYCNKWNDLLKRVAELEAERDRMRDVCDQQAQLLFWGESLMKSMSRWTSSHPSEFIDWKESWRVVKEQYKALEGEDW